MVHVLRAAVIIAIAFVVYVMGVGELFAASDNWPAFELPQKLTTNFRGPGSYLSLFKIFAAWLVFLGWVKTTDWVNTDLQELNHKQLNYLQWNPIVFGTFMAAFVLMWLIPRFWVGFLLLLVAYITPLLTYIFYRDSLVDEDIRIITPERIRYWYATCLNKVGVKVKMQEIDSEEVTSGPRVKLLGHGGPDNRTNNARSLLAKQSPGFSSLTDMIVEVLDGRATAIMLDYTEKNTALNIMVDGVWVPREPKERKLADSALESLKILCGLNPQERQKRQKGTFLSEYESGRYVTTLTSQGTPAGERVLIQFDDSAVSFKNFDDLGMRVKMQGQLKELLQSQKGFLLFSAMPSGGLRTTTDVTLHTCDRFLREFSTVEEENSHYRSVENVALTTYKAADGETPATVLTQLFRKEPNVVVVRDLVNAETVSILCKGTADKLIIGTIRAKDCIEALLGVLALGVPSAEFATAITAVVNQRLVRKLCSDCMESYVPPSQVLQQLGIPEGRIEAFYQPPESKPSVFKTPCKTCGGIGYVGRTAIFELLVVGDAVREVLTSKPNPELLRRAARKDGMKSIQEEGILLVAKGVTSLQELMRILKQ